jgi:hypothetical protein
LHLLAVRAFDPHARNRDGLTARFRQRKRLLERDGSG